MAGGVERAGSAMIPSISELSTPLNCRPAESDLVSDEAGVGDRPAISGANQRAERAFLGQQSDAAQT